MFITKIKYTDFDGEEREDTLYFNLSKVELARLELKYPGGLKKLVEKLNEEKDNKKIWEIFEDLIRMSYGIKSVDGKRFTKNKEVLAEFEESNAYSEFIFSLFDAEKASAFVNGLLSSITDENKSSIPAPAVELVK